MMGERNSPSPVGGSPQARPQARPAASPQLFVASPSRDAGVLTRSQAREARNQTPQVAQDQELCKSVEPRTPLNQGILSPNLTEPPGAPRKKKTRRDAEDQQQLSASAPVRKLDFGSRPMLVEPAGGSKTR